MNTTATTPANTPEFDEFLSGAYLALEGSDVQHYLDNAVAYGTGIRMNGDYLTREYHNFSGGQTVATHPITRSIWSLPGVAA